MEVITHYNDVLYGIKTVWLAGEVFPTIYFNKWFDRLPNAKFVNLYGPIEIIAYCELDRSITIQEFRTRLRNILPTYMIPAKLVEVEKMAMNTNGKIDRLVYKRLSEK